MVLDILGAHISRMCATLHSKFQHVNSRFSKSAAELAGACLPVLQLFSVITRWPAGPSERCVCVCVRSCLCGRARGRTCRGVIKKGVWEGRGENTTASCLAAHAAAWSDFRPRVSPEGDL